MLGRNDEAVDGAPSVAELAVAAAVQLRARHLERVGDEAGERLAVFAGQGSRGPEELCARASPIAIGDVLEQSRDLGPRSIAWLSGVEVAVLDVA